MVFYSTLVFAEGNSAIGNFVLGQSNIFSEALICLVKYASL